MSAPGAVKSNGYADDTPQTSDARHLIEVRGTPDSGLGVFAKASIPRATRILSEPILPESIQKAVPEKLERALPNKLHDTGPKQ